MLTQMDCFGLTDLGRKRPTNQDHYLIADLNKSMRVHHTSLSLSNETRIYGGSQGKLLVVADGMGGETAGERACIIAVDQVTTYVLNSLAWCFRLEEDSEHDFEDDLKSALKSCQKSIQIAVSNHPEMSSMGTTLTMVYIVWPRAFVVHVGDSRCYLHRNRQLGQITIDHTVSEIMVKSGQMSREDARHSPMGHTLWNVLGGGSNELSVDVYRLTLQRDDILLLCTDGLYDMVPHEKLQEVLNYNTSAEAACRTLVDLANENGGRDNITVIVSHVQPPHPLDEPRAYVEAEVPLEELTAAKSHTTTKHVRSDRAERR
jgi:serine/threonine protein phosphatase PrpC